MATNFEVADSWARGIDPQNRPRAANMFYECTRIYSYGHHYILARRYNRNGNTYALINSAATSITTTKHKSVVARAITRHSGRYMFVPNVAADCETAHVGNMDYLLACLTPTRLFVAKSDRKRLSVVNVTEKSLRNAMDYAAFFGVAIPTRHRIDRPTAMRIATELSPELTRALVAAGLVQD